MEIYPEEMLREYGKGIYTLAMKLCRNRYDADDLFQAVFLKAAEKGGLDKTRNVSSYLYTVTLNIYRKQYAKRKRETQIIYADDTDDKPADAPTPEDDYITKERQRCIRRCINEMDDKYRLAVILYYDLEWKVDKIANHLNIPGGTVKTRLKKAREIIKKRLEAEQWIT